MKTRIFILSALLLLMFAFACAKDTTAVPDHGAVKELFEKAAGKLIMYATEEPSRVLNSDFDNTLEIDYSGEETIADGRPYIKTDLNYRQAVDKYSELFTGDALDEFLSRYFYDMDGVLYVTPAGGATGYTIQNVEIALAEQSGGEYFYSFKATFDLFEPVESRFSVKKVGDDYRISGMDYVFGP